MRSLLDAVVGFFSRRDAAQDEADLAEYRQTMFAQSVRDLTVNMEQMADGMFDADAAKADSDLREYWRAPVTVSHGIVTDEDHATAPAEALPDPASMSLADRMHFSFLAEQAQAAEADRVREHEEETERWLEAMDEQQRFWEEMEAQQRFWDEFDEDRKRRWEDDSNSDADNWLPDSSITDDIQQALDDADNSSSMHHDW